MPGDISHGDIAVGGRGTFTGAADIEAGARNRLAGAAGTGPLVLIVFGGRSLAAAGGPVSHGRFTAGSGITARSGIATRSRIVAGSGIATRSRFIARGRAATGVGCLIATGA